jgi:long-subunit acyl-CoA synthetase (AMP-forming)
MESAAAERYVTGGPAKELASENLFRALEETVAKHGDEIAVRAMDDSVTCSWNELLARTKSVAGGLASLGVEKGDCIAILINNGPDFMPIDLGAVALGAVPFSIYQTSAPEQIQYVCSDSEAKVAFVEPEFLERFEEARKDLPKLEQIVVVGGDAPEGAMTLAELEAKGEGFDTEPIVSSIAPDDLLTLIYTSGTTGPPKGVQLTHRNLLTLTASVDGIVPFPEDGGKVISWLPAAHIAERGAHYYLPVVMGLTVTICPDPRKIIEVLPQVRPTWFFAVPRIWEKLRAGLEAMLAGLPDEQREPAQKGLEAALAKVRAEQAGEEVPEEIAAAAAKADEQLFAGLRAHLGLDEVVAVNVGAAPTPLEVLEFFHAIGIKIGELWGMSETCGVATLNPPDRVKLGTVGPPVPGCEIKLAEDGEVLVRTPANMPGYRNMPEKNAETIDSEGWLLTGDIGELDEDGYLKIVDRKKELIINAAGKNMSPASIESKLKAASPLIGQACAIGDMRPYNVALIVLDPDFAPGWAQKNGLDPDAESLVAKDELLSAIQAGVDAANAKMSRVEQIKKFKILPQDWAPGGDELTPTMKLKRKPISAKYTEEIEALYAD